MGRLVLGLSKLSCVQTWCPLNMLPRHVDLSLVLGCFLGVSSWVVLGCFLGGQRNAETMIGHESPVIDLLTFCICLPFSARAFQGLKQMAAQPPASIDAPAAGFAALVLQTSMVGFVGVGGVHSVSRRANVPPLHTHAPQHSLVPCRAWGLHLDEVMRVSASLLPRQGLNSRYHTQTLCSASVPMPPLAPPLRRARSVAGIGAAG